MPKETKSTSTAGAGKRTTRRREQNRLLCSRETMTVTEQGLVDAIATTRRLISRTEYTDALVTVALRHADEVHAELAAAEDAGEEGEADYESD